MLLWALILVAFGGTRTVLSQWPEGPQTLVARWMESCGSAPGKLAPMVAISGGQTVTWWLNDGWLMVRWLVAGMN